MPVTYPVPLHVRLASVFNVWEAEKPDLGAKDWQGTALAGMDEGRAGAMKKEEPQLKNPIRKNQQWWSKLMSRRVGQGVPDLLPFQVGYQEVKEGAHQRKTNYRWTEIEKGIEKHFAKRYSDNKHSLKSNYWNVKHDETHDMKAIRSRPPPNVKQSD
ncbi:hypothetical protein Tco_0588266 [Tanacetum coccineum]